MKIQIITNQLLGKSAFPSVKVSKLEKPQSLDEFDCVVIDLSASTIWKNDERSTKTVNCTNDFFSVKQMVERKTHAMVFYVFPGNLVFTYDAKYSVHHSVYLKDCIVDLIGILKDAIPNGEIDTNFKLIYEPTKTTVDNRVYFADFYFDKATNPLSKSDASEKITTIQWTNTVYLTTLNILKSEQDLIDYINSLVPHNEQEAEPEWVKQIACFDDECQYNIINDNNAVIIAANQKIEKAQKKLAENARYKSILYTNGDELVEVVFEILQKLLDCDLSHFEDKKKEDFLIQKAGYTLIGEIKGVSSNIRSEHISQADVHYQGYMDRLDEENRQENVHEVLIINPFKNKPLSERDPVHDTQITLAKRNDCLIIETTTLLKLFEKFVAGEIDVGLCEKLFTEKTGLLKESDF